MRFTSHRDFSRAFERAVFRAQVPMAYSSGFNPHPRISYAGAAPTGSASEAEYLEIALAQVVDPAAVKAQLVEALPEGLDMIEVAESRGGSLADLLQASHWQLDLAVEADLAAAAVSTFLAADEISVERMTKKGLRTFDCRAAVRSMTATPTERGVRLDVLLVHGVPSVRPDDVLTGLHAVAGLEAVAGGTLLTRVAQGRLLDDDTIGDPLA
ncbi:radical SAM protein [Nocardioides sp. Soil797]|nr:radical SAM protein [Nocardioides sp. Soil797]